jgi:hypothetical protein
VVAFLNPGKCYNTKFQEVLFLELTEEFLWSSDQSGVQLYKIPKNAPHTQIFLATVKAFHSINFIFTEENHH